VSRVPSALRTRRLIGRMATGKFAHFFTFGFVYTEGPAWALAAALHMLAHMRLRFFRRVNWPSKAVRRRCRRQRLGQPSLRSRGEPVKARAFRSFVFRSGCNGFLDMPFATCFALESI